MSDRNNEENFVEEEDLLAWSIKKAKELESIEEVMDDPMMEKS